MISYLVDIAFVAVIAISAIFAYKKGFIYTVFDLIGKLLAAIVARILSLQFAPVIYETYLQAGIRSTLAQKLEGISNSDIVQQVESIINSIPESLGGIVSLLGVNSETLAEKTQELELAGENALEMLMTNIVTPLAVAVCKIVLFAVLSIVLLFAFSIVVKLLSKIIKKIPGLKQLNSGLGVVAGVLRGIVIVLILAVVLPFIASVIKNESFIQAVQSSMIVEIANGIITSIGGYSA